MTDANPGPAAPPAAVPKRNRWTRIAYIAAAVALLIAGGVQLIVAWTLPACDRSVITDTLRELFKSKDVELTLLDDIEELSATGERKTCSARFETADETGTVEYSITWQGWSPYVKVESVDAAPRTPADSGGASTPAAIPARPSP